MGKELDETEIEQVFQNEKLRLAFPQAFILKAQITKDDLEACKILYQGTDQHPYNSDMRIALAKRLIQAKNFQEAFINLNQNLKFEYRSQETWSLLAEVYSCSADPSLLAFFKENSEVFDLKKLVNEHI